MLSVGKNICGKKILVVEHTPSGSPGTHILDVERVHVRVVFEDQLLQQEECSFVVYMLSDLQLAPSKRIRVQYPKNMSCELQKENSELFTQALKVMHWFIYTICLSEH